MQNKSRFCVSVFNWAFCCGVVALLAACANSVYTRDSGDVPTPTVDYIESLDVYSAPHRDSFLNQLAMNYRSYAIYNARTSGYSEMGELFAQKAVAAFSGETPFPEGLGDWPVDGEMGRELADAYGDLMEQLKNDASYTNPELAAEAQAKYDCWLSAAASGQDATADECRNRYYKTMTALRDCTGGKIVKPVAKARVVEKSDVRVASEYYPETRNMASIGNATRTREGVIIVNNVNVPEHLINPEPVQPLVFNQNIYGGDKSISNSNNNNGNSLTSVRECPLARQNAGECSCQKRNDAGTCVSPVVIMEQPQSPQQPSVVVIEGQPQPQPAPIVVVEEHVSEPQPVAPVRDDLVTRAEFVDMMMAMRAELAAINKRLDDIQATAGEKTMIKVQQIPLEPKQHVMEEIFEVRFDFDKSNIKPEYQDLIHQLAAATQSNKNIKVSVVGHTDTAGSNAYNYALGGRRAEAVRKMLIGYGIPASQIVAVSSGEEDLKIQTPDGTPNAENRRVRVVKETQYTSIDEPRPVTMEIQEYSGVSMR
ncbi:MAG: OmpA family protein [Alphaproteobacteria bacterium]|nr:OmpA family protein [Alphaproteobacteria bacterium]